MNASTSMLPPRAGVSFKEYVESMSSRLGQQNPVQSLEETTESISKRSSLKLSPRSRIDNPDNYRTPDVISDQMEQSKDIKSRLDVSSPQSQELLSENAAYQFPSRAMSSQAVTSEANLVQEAPENPMTKTNGYAQRPSQGDARSRTR